MSRTAKAAASRPAPKQRKSHPVRCKLCRAPAWVTHALTSESGIFRFRRRKCERGHVAETVEFWADDGDCLALEDRGHLIRAARETIRKVQKVRRLGAAC